MVRLVKNDEKNFFLSKYGEIKIIENIKNIKNRVIVLT